MAAEVEHWSGVYSTKAETAVSWYQPVPKRSLELIRQYSPELDTPIVDIGGGASRLVDELLAVGYTDLAVLDIAASGLQHSQARLGAIAHRVDWIVADITDWRPPRRWGVWHDRAVLHFMTTSEGQEAYLAALTEGTASGSIAIIATFALDGPERCSGLPVQRYSATTLAARLGPEFELQAEVGEVHRTPWDSTQSFTYAVFRRR